MRIFAVPFTPFHTFPSFPAASSHSLFPSLLFCLLLFVISHSCTFSVSPPFFHYNPAVTRSHVTPAIYNLWGHLWRLKKAKQKTAGCETFHLGLMPKQLQSQYSTYWQNVELYLFFNYFYYFFCRWIWCCLSPPLYRTCHIHTAVISLWWRTQRWLIECWLCSRLQSKNCHHLPSSWLISNQKDNGKWNFRGTLGRTQDKTTYLITNS